MDVQRAPLDVESGECQESSAVPPSRILGPLRGERVGRALGEWQAGELRLARSFAECRGLAHQQLEDIYQETALVLLKRAYESEEHLRNALRWGIKHRALHLHRDDRRRGEILEQRTPELRLAAEAREGEWAPEQSALVSQDRLVVAEFLTELTALETRLFWLTAEGLRYRAIAPLLGITVNEARKVSRSYERKRERFQLLYDTGRLCGYRSQTIRAMQAGRETSATIARQAFAHLDGCQHCRAEHNTNARRLRSTFQGQAAAMLPVPLITAGAGALERFNARARTIHHRFGAYTPPGTGGVRERTIAMLATGGAGAKLAAAGASVVVLAGGTIGASGVLRHAPTRPRHARRVTRPHPQPAAQRSEAHTATIAPTTASVGAGRAVLATVNQASSKRAKHQEATGFGFLGVPDNEQHSPSRASAASANTTTTQHAGSQSQSPAPAQRGGGPFSP
jgi:RNA polymerase sigma factor (sigma-70 family)